MLSTRLAQNTGYALSHQTSDHFLNKTKQKHIIDMFMLLNTAAIGMVYVIVSPCELDPIDGRIKNFKKDFGRVFPLGTPRLVKNIYLLSICA